MDIDRVHDRETQERTGSEKDARLKVLPRCASYTHVAELKVKSIVVSSTTWTSEEAPTTTMELSTITDETTDLSSPGSSGYTTPDEMFGPRSSPLDDQELILELQITPCSSIGEASSEKDEELGDIGTEIDSDVKKESLPAVSTKSTSVQLSRPRPSASASSFRLTRRSWCESTPAELDEPLAALSTDPSAHITRYQLERDAELSSIQLKPLKRPQPAHSRKKSLVRRKSFAILGEKSTTAFESASASTSATLDKATPPMPNTRRGSFLRLKSKPVSELFRFSAKDAKERLAPPLSVAGPRHPKKSMFPMSFSTDKLPSLASGFSDRATPVPRLLSAERLTTSNDGPHKRDELWTVFRALEGDFARFSSKSTSFRTNVVRSTLMPFLRTYARHPSNVMLRVEDLERRAMILSKWWNGLLEMLQGRQNQSVSGTDRPTVLEALSGIMERPEWRMSSSHFLSDQSSDHTMAISGNNVQSKPSSILVETIQHNVRTIFTQNLTTQMAFVVEKMSLRHASASLVTYCGKACAYAFMFVPGMAALLLRLWKLCIHVMERVARDVGIGKLDNLTAIAQAIGAQFPSHMKALELSSLSKFVRMLRTPPTLPTGTTSIDWWGHWLERWSGRESDLFYVFSKHYYILIADFMESSCSPQELLCAPGMLAVNSQLLSILDQTFRRSATGTPSEASPSGFAASPHTLNPVLLEPDAVAPALVSPPPDGSRNMGENRVIMLIRDFLADRKAERATSRRWFAESFNRLLQTAAKKISVFDHNACYLLLDFLEEAFLIMVRYENSSTGGPLLDTAFWESAYRGMIDSRNTLTEIRLYAFLHAAWRFLVYRPERKKSLCVNFLLDERVFLERFNHWCPMVRAYYMRLLCWCVGRWDGDRGGDEELILETLLARLQMVWSHYLFLEAQAMSLGRPAPVSSPCNPAPHRRLFIIRTDTKPHNDSFLSFDGIVSPAEERDASPPSGSTGRPDGSRTASQTESNLNNETGISALFRKVVNGPTLPVSRQKSPSLDVGSASSPASSFPRLDRSQYESTQRGNRMDQRLKGRLNFKFTLEYVPNGRGLSHNARLQAPRLPLPAQMFLQTISARARAVAAVDPAEVPDKNRAHARYFGMAIAEWNMVVGECHCFYERRKYEGVSDERMVEIPALGVEAFRRPS